MYKICAISDFSAAHMLRGYKGKCENMHGHNWKVEVFVSAKELDEIGMVIDFKEIKKALNAVLEELDHKNLNETAYFKKVNPTSENIAKYIYDRLFAQQLAADGRRLKVKVWESDTACAIYEE
ncbi:MAG: 6-carboxytetrahydropterin synthase QueD [Candidatus Omnitrophica bacterium]|nr:6-carboxytetrahydropterin synthase QueD [Candidatus Omnitrophota bacterium]